MPVTFRDRRRRPAPSEAPPRPSEAQRRWWSPARRLAIPSVVLLGLLGHVFARVAATGDTSPPAAKPPEVVRCALAPLKISPLPCASAILIEAETGIVLYEQNADELRGPASLVKMMLQWIVFEGLSAGEFALGDSVVTSANASTMGGSQVFLKHGEVQTLESMMDAVIIASANDAAMAVAEYIAGSESAFVARMNEEAARIGCTGTKFANVHGLDLRGRPRNVTTARDLAVIARHLVRHPKALEISSTWRKPFRGGEFWLDNTNKLLRDFDGLDGLKTGWTPRAGGCFVGTAQREGVRLIAVVLRAPGGKGRFTVTARLLEAGYESGPRWVEVVRAGQVVPIAQGMPVAEDPQTTARAAAWGTVRVLLEDGRTGSWRLRPHPELRAPLREGGELGYLDYRLDGRTVATVPARVAKRT